MSYTSPSPANVGLNGNQTTWWIPARNLSIHTATNVVVTVTVSPAGGLAPVTYLPEVGTFNFTTGKWNIGTLAAGTTKWLKIVTSVSDIGLAPFTVTSVITGDGIDPNNINNTLVQTLTSVAATVTAGAIADEGCSCIDVSLNDVACSYGTTEWRLSSPVVNSTVHDWDVTTGKGRFIHDNPFEDITTTYSVWCDTGTGFVEISGPVTVTINKLFADISIWDHVPQLVQYSDLSPADIVTLTAQYPAETLSDYCWNILRNGEGTLTGGTPVDCNEAKDTRTFFYCSATPCVVDLGECECAAELPADVTSQLPVGYAPEDGDVVYIMHPESTSIWTYVKADLRWVRSSCGCIYKISQDAGNLIELGSDNAPYLSADIILDATDEKAKVSANDTTSGFLNGKLVAGAGIVLTETNDGGNETLVIAATAPPSTNVQVADTPSINMGITGTGTVPDPFIISGAYNDGSPIPQYAAGTPGSTGNTLDVTTLFGMPCAGAFTATYTLNGYSTEVYDNVTLVGTTLTYDILLTAPSGTHYINVQRVCA